uniref:Uncharacterized protein n=1 Tax=Sphaerodactylus townsendi TaxID=933632 RepID=A0ACB8EHC2_9SAUR
MVDVKHGNAVSGSVAYRNAGNALCAGNVVRDGTGVGAGYAGVGDSGGGDDKGVDSAYDNTENGGCALVLGSALQLTLSGALQKNAGSVADVKLWGGAEAAVTGQVLDGLGKVSPFYYQIRTLVVRKN